MNICSMCWKQFLFKNKLHIMYGHSYKLLGKYDEITYWCVLQLLLLFLCMLDSKWVYIKWDVLVNQWEIYILYLWMFFFLFNILQLSTSMGHHSNAEKSMQFQNTWGGLAKSVIWRCGWIEVNKKNKQQPPWQIIKKYMYFHQNVNTQFLKKIESK